MKKDDLLIELEISDIENEINFDGETENVCFKLDDNFCVSNEIQDLVRDIKNFDYTSFNEEKRYKILCGYRPYNKCAVQNNKLYKNGIAFIVDPTNFVVPCSLLRVYSLFFKSTDKAVSLIVELVKNKISHEQFAKYIFYKHGIELINCFPAYKAMATNLATADFKDVEEVLCIGKVAYDELVKTNIIPQNVKTGVIVHSSGLTYNVNEYFKTWHLYQDSAIKHNKGIKFDDFKI